MSRKRVWCVLAVQWMILSVSAEAETWVKRLTTPDSALDTLTVQELAESPDGSVFALGSIRPLSLSLKQQPQTLAAGERRFRPRASSVTCGSHPSHEGSAVVLMKIGANGSGQWLYRYDAGTCFYAQGLSATDDGGAILYANTGVLDNPAFAVIFRIGSDGRVVWSRELHSPQNGPTLGGTARAGFGTSLVRMGTDEWVAIAHPGVVRFNGNGQFVSEQLMYMDTIENQILPLMVSGLGAAPDGYLLASGANGTILTRMGWEATQSRAC